MARIGFDLDTKNIISQLKVQLISGETVQFPDYTADGYGVFIIYRGGW